MRVLKATIEQYNELNHYTNGVNILEFTQDVKGNWIVGTQVLQDDAFEEIRTKLAQLEEIDYIEPVIGDI